MTYLQPRRANYPLEISCASYGNKKDIGAFVNSSSDNSPANKRIQQRLTEAVIAFRPWDQEDIPGVLLTNSKQLDLDWVRMKALLAGIPRERLEAFEQLVREYYIAKRS